MIGAEPENETLRPNTSYTQNEIVFAGLYSGIDPGGKSPALSIFATLPVLQRHKKVSLSYSTVVQAFFNTISFLCKLEQDSHREF